MANTPSVPFLTKIAQIFEIAGFSDQDVWEGSPEVFLVISHFHAEIRASERYSETPLRVYFPKTTDGRFGEVESKDYQVDKTWPISKVLRIILKKFNVTPEEAAKFVLVSSRDFPLDVDRCLADYGLGSLFRSWQVKLAFKEDVEKAMEARKREIMETKKIPPPRPKKSAKEALEASKALAKKKKKSSTKKSSEGKEKGEKSEKTEKAEKKKSIPSTLTSTSRTKSNTSLKLSGLQSSSDLLSNSEGSEDTSGGVDAPPPASPRHERSESKSKTPRGPDSARGESKSHSRLLSSSKKSSQNLAATNTSSSHSEDTFTSESVDTSPDKDKNDKHERSEKSDVKEKSSTTEEASSKPEKAERKKRKLDKSLIAAAASKLKGARKARHHHHNNNNNNNTPSLSTSVANPEPSSELGTSSTPLPDLSQSLPARPETLRPKSRTVPILLLIQPNDLFNGTKVKSANWSITMSIRRLIRAVLERANIPVSDEYALCDLYGRALHPLATLTTYGLDERLGKWELILVRSPEAASLASRPFASKYSWIRNKDVLPRLQLSEAKRIIIELDEKVNSYETRDLNAEYDAKCKEVETLKSEVAVLKESERTLTQIFGKMAAPADKKSTTGGDLSTKERSSPRRELSTVGAEYASSMEALFEDLKNSKKQINDIQRMYEEANAARTKLQADLDAERASKQADLNRLTATHASEVSTLSEYSDALFAKNSELVSEMEQLNSEIFDHRRRAKLSDREKEEARAGVLELTAELEEERRKRDMEREQNVRLIETLTTQVATLKDRTAQLLSSPAAALAATAPPLGSTPHSHHPSQSVSVDEVNLAKTAAPISTVHEELKEDAEGSQEVDELEKSESNLSFRSVSPVTAQSDFSSTEVDSNVPTPVVPRFMPDDSTAEDDDVEVVTETDYMLHSYQVPLSGAESSAMSSEEMRSGSRDQAELANDEEKDVPSESIPAIPVVAHPPPPPPPPPMPIVSSTSQDTSEDPNTQTAPKVKIFSPKPVDVDLSGASLQDEITAQRSALKAPPPRVPPKPTPRNMLLDSIQHFSREALHKAGPPIKREKEPDQLAKALYKRFVAMADFGDVETLDDDDDDGWSTSESGVAPSAPQSSALSITSPGMPSAMGDSNRGENIALSPAVGAAHPPIPEKKTSLYEDESFDIFDDDDDEEDTESDSDTEDDTTSLGSALSRSTSVLGDFDDDMDDDEGDDDDQDEESDEEA